MTNVVGLHGGEFIQPGESVPSVVDELERLLEMARSGEIKGIVCAVMHSDDCVSGTRKGETGYRIVGLLTKMIHDFCAERE